MPEYSVYLFKEEAGLPVVIFCKPSWDYTNTIELIKKAKGMEAWDTSFKFSHRANQDFFFLTNGKAVSGDGMRFVGIDRNNADFLKETIQPLADAGFIPQEAVNWFKKDD